MNLNIVLTNNGTTSTTIALTVVDGKSYTIGLKNSSPSAIQELAKAQTLTIYNSENKNIFNINSSENESLNVTVNSLYGRCLLSIKNQASPYLLDLTNLSKGIYIVSARTKAEYLNKKLIIE